MLTVKESALISSLSNLGFDLGMQLHATGCKAIAKAYSSKDDGGEFARAIYDAIPFFAQKPFAGWLRRHGLNVAMGETAKDKAIIGGVLNSKNADRHIRASKEDVVILPLVAAHIPAKKEKKPVAAGRPQAEIVAAAKKKFASFVESAKKADPEVGAAINQLIQKPAWMDKLAALNLTQEEAEEIVDAIRDARTAATASLLKLAA